MSTRRRRRVHGARLRRRGALLTATAAVVALALGVGVAAAYWAYTDSSNSNFAEAAAGTVNAGKLPTVVVTGRDVTVSWAAATVFDGTAAQGYVVAKSNTVPGVSRGARTAVAPRRSPG